MPNTSYCEKYTSGEHFNLYFKNVNNFYSNWYINPIIPSGLYCKRITIIMTIVNVLPNFGASL